MKTLEILAKYFFSVYISNFKGILSIEHFNKDVFYGELYNIRQKEYSP